MKNEPFNKVDYYRTFPQFIDTVAVKYKDKPAVSYYTKAAGGHVHLWGIYLSDL